MHDFRPVAHVIGRLMLALGLSMLAPWIIDLVDRNGNAPGMLMATFLTTVAGLGLAIVTRQPESRSLSRQQAFLLTTLVWAALPVFGALPMMLGAPELSFTDAYFEAMSGLTTTGATVISGLDDSPRGLLLWRALLQWYGGLGILVVAMVFLPTLKVGGMQIFRSESFELQDEILPRAAEAAQSLSTLYAGLTLACMLAYSASGMNGFDALCHAMTTISTGGLANYDASFGAFGPATQYVASVFLILSGMPFLKLVQFFGGRTGPLWRDSQSRVFVAIWLTGTAVLTLVLVLGSDRAVEPAVRAALFNAASILTGTGYGSEDFSLWGPFAGAVFMTLALIGGCAGSTACSAKVFRYQILFSALVAQVRRIHSPHGVFPMRFAGRPVSEDVLSSVMAFFFVFVCAIALTAILLSMFGLSALTSVSGAIAILTNVGPGLGPELGPAGSYAFLPDGAKWLLSFGMLFGRLECLSVLVLFTPSFWAR